MRTANRPKNVTKMDLGSIRSDLERLFEENVLLHVSLREGRKRLEDVPSTITGVYNHFVCVTAHIKNYVDETLTINYIDIVIGKFKIKELDELYAAKSEN